MGIGILNS